MTARELWKRISSLTVPVGYHLARLSDIRRRETSLLLPAFLFFLVWFLGQALLFPILLWLKWDLATARALATLITNALTLLLLLSWLWFIKPYRLKLAGIRSRDLPYDCAIGSQIGILLAAIMIVGLKISTDFCVFVGEPTTIEAWLFIDSSIAGLLFRISLAVIFAPLLEEVLFRGLMYTALRRASGELFATVFTAFLFALVHLHPVTSPQFWFIVLLGVVWARCREQTDSILPALISHSLLNLSVVLGSWNEGYLLRNSTWFSLSLLILVLAVFYLAIALLDEISETTIALISRTGGALALLCLLTILFFAQSDSPALSRSPAMTALRTLRMTTHGDYSLAEKTLVEFLSRYPSEPKLWYRLAAIRYDQEKYTEALKVAQTLSENEGVMAQALRANLEALCLAELGQDLDRALFLARQSLDLTEPNSPFYLAALDTLGWIHYHRKDYVKAQYYVQLAKSRVGWLRTPQVSVLDYHLAMILLARGKDKEGLELLKTVLSARHGHKPSIKRSQTALAKLGLSIATSGPRS